MCDNCQQYLYHHLTEQFKQDYLNNESIFYEQHVSCLEYLHNINIPLSLYNLVWPTVSKDFEGSSNLDIANIISFIALGVTCDLDSMFSVFLHFSMKHGEIFWKLKYKGSYLFNSGHFNTDVYKYCYDLAKTLIPTSQRSLESQLNKSSN